MWGKSRNTCFRKDRCDIVEMLKLFEGSYGYEDSFSLGDMEILSQAIMETGDLVGLWDTYAFAIERLTGGRARIINFHRVADAKPYPWMSLSAFTLRAFEDRIRYICSKYNLLTLEELADRISRKQTLPQGSIVVTFDDGYKDMYLNAYPILRKYNVPATVFLTTGHIGTGELFWWDKIGYVIYNTRLDRIELNGISYSSRTIEDKARTVDALILEANKESEEKKKALISSMITVANVKVPDNLGEKLILSWSEIQEMSSNAIDFGAHTITHPILTRISLEQAKYEILQSRAEIQNRLNKPVHTFAYPRGHSGDFSGQIAMLLEQAGFKCAVTAIPGMVSQQAALYNFSRIAPGKNHRAFKFLASGFWYDLQALRSLIKFRFYQHNRHKDEIELNKN